MKKNVDLLSEPIVPALTRLAVPIMATSLLQMAYNLTDMVWIGKLGSGAVTAVGTGGLYLWFSQGVVDLAKVGGQVKVAQSLGAGRDFEAGQYAKGSLQLGILFSVIFGLSAIFGARLFIGFFGLTDPTIIAESEVYFRITCGAILFSFMNAILTGIYTACGDSKTPFVANSFGLAANFVLDPVLIFGLGPAPKLGVAGAAAATVTAQLVVMLLFIVSVRKEQRIFNRFRLFSKTSIRHINGIVRIGLPAAVQKMIMAGISMVLTRLVAGWGHEAVAVQRVGSQVESISWMTAEGFAAALNSFTGQNFGAGQYDRVKDGYRKSVKLITVWGILTTVALYAFSVPIFRIFIKETSVVTAGSDYLKILALSQLFMCIEILTIGAYSGLGKTTFSSGITTVFTLARIPMAVAFSATSLGLNGIWWALTVSSVFKGVVFLACYHATLKKLTSHKTI